MYHTFKLTTSIKICVYIYIYPWLTWGIFQVPWLPVCFANKTWWQKKKTSSAPISTVVTNSSPNYAFVKSSSIFNELDFFRSKSPWRCTKIWSILELVRTQFILSSMFPFYIRNLDFHIPIDSCPRPCPMEQNDSGLWCEYNTSTLPKTNISPENQCL